MAESDKASASGCVQLPCFSDQPESVAALLTLMRDKYGDDAVTIKGNAKTGFRRLILSVKDAFVKLVLVPSDEMEQRVGPAAQQGTVAESERLMHAYDRPSQHVQPIELKDILEHAAQTLPGQPRRASSRLLALACAGAGKTMIFARKAPLDWAEGKIWREMELVFVLPLRLPEVHNADDLAKLLRLKYYGICTNAKQEEICEHVMAHLDRVCLIMDGLDEISLQTCSAFVRGVVTGDTVRGARVIVTSRPSTEILNLASEHPFDRRIEVTGFSKADVGQYVGKVLPAEHAAKMMRQVNASAYLSSFMRVPVNAATICTAYRDGCEELPTTLPEIVSFMLLAAVKQQQARLGMAAKLPSRWQKISFELRQPALELGTFALRMLADKITVFEEHHFDQCQLSAAAQSLGLLVSCEDVLHAATPQWTFSHLTLQEALAARSVSARLTAGEIPWLVCQLGALSGHLNTFWRLLAAEVSEESVVALITAIITGTAAVAESLSASGEQEADLTNITHFLRASRDDMLELADKLSSHLTIEDSERLADVLLREVVTGSGSLAIKSAMAQGTDLTGSSFLRQLLVFWVGHIPLAIIHTLYKAMASVNQSTAARCFPSCVLDAGDVSQGSANEIASLANLGTEEGKHLLLLALQCYYEYTVACGTSPSIPALSKAMERFGVDLFGVRLTPSDCRAIACALQQYHDIIGRVVITGCNIGDFGYEQLAPGLEKCTNLSLLRIEDNNLTGQHGQHIANVIRQNHVTLRGLGTSRNSFTSDDVALVHRHVHMCQALTFLMFGGNEATDQVQNITTISTILSSCKDLDRIMCVGLIIGDSGLCQLLPHLIDRQLIPISLVNTGLTVESSSTLCRLIQHHCNGLMYLNLSENALTDACLVELHDTLARCSNLTHLYLEATQLTSASLGLLGRLLGCFPRLNVLYIQDNDFSMECDEDSECFVQGLTGCKQLQKLHMPKSELVYPVLKDLLRHASLPVHYS